MSIQYYGRLPTTYSRGATLTVFKRVFNTATATTALECLSTAPPHTAGVLKPVRSWAAATALECVSLILSSAAGDFVMFRSLAAGFFFRF